MRYVRVNWLHEIEDEPIVIYSELDDSYREHRKVEILRNGGMDYADRHTSKGDIGLSKEPIPTLEEIAADPQFEPCEISKDEFESIWLDALKRQ